MQPAIKLRHAISGNKPVIGILLSNHIWLELIEVCREAGLDYVIIDSEHLQHDVQQIADACMLGRMTNFPVLLRPATTDAASIRMAMDLGPCGLLLPMIETAEQLDEVTRGAYMPPRGGRRPGGPGNRWLKQFSYETFKSNVEDHLIVIPQIESAAGLRNAREIANHPITTALGIGPFDLSAGLGVCWEPQHPVFQRALTELRAAADDARRPMWMIGDPAALLREGYHFVCMGDPVGLLQAALTNVIANARAGTIGTPSVADPNASAYAPATPQ